MHTFSNHSIGESNPEEIFEMAKRLDFQNICLADFPDMNVEEFKKLSKIAPEYNINLFSRVDLIGNQIDELKKDLKKFRRAVNLCAIMITDKRVSRWAARDSRFDIFFFPTKFDPKLFDRSSANFCSENSIAIEINIRPLLKTYGVVRSKFLRNTRKVVDTALKKEIVLLISSGAKSIYEMRAPKELISLGTLINIPEELGKQCLTKNPEQIITSNIEKMREGYITEGLRIITNSGLEET